tara:strand:+ start:5710 stop:6099 length:390 start_codon:yes stop_codon:yes gene_type:complete
VKFCDFDSSSSIFGDVAREYPLQDRWSERNESEARMMMFGLLVSLGKFALIKTILAQKAKNIVDPIKRNFFWILNEMIRWSVLDRCRNQNIATADNITMGTPFNSVQSVMDLRVPGALGIISNCHSGIH